MLLKLVYIVKRYYWVIILLVLFVSYGQTLFMLPWQDDNALFFKLAHIKEPAGYLGKGIFGEGPYKYTAFFYYPIYLIFGFRPFFYFAFGLLLYTVSTYVVYKITAKMLDKKAGMLAGFLYACGLIASDGYIRIFNSVITSLSVVLVLLFFYAYWKFYKEKMNLWYFLSLLFFFLASEFARARTHYLIAIPVLYEVLFFVFRKPVFKSMIFSISRLIPFLFLFNRYVLMEDIRSRQAIIFVKSIIEGNFYNLFGFLSSITNLVLPNWLIPFSRVDLNNLWTRNYLTGSIFHYLFFFTFLLVVCVFTAIKSKKSKFYVGITLTFSFLWLYVSTKIFVDPAINVSDKEIFIAFLGGEIIYFFVLVFFLIERKFRLLYLFLLISTLTNILSYSIYSPNVVFEKTNRYLAHSFLFLVSLFSLLYFASIKNKNTSKIILSLIILWGIDNAIGSFAYQRKILLYRIAPVKSFYRQLKIYLPTISKKNVLLFDVADNARGNFADAFSVAQMPETTAIAWRYGLDRYDIYRVTDFEDLIKTVQTKNIPLENVYSFFYSSGELTNTTEKIRSLLKTGGRKFVLNETLINNGNAEIAFDVKETVESIVPIELELWLRAEALNFNNINYPYVQNRTLIANKISQNKDLREIAFAYKRFKKDFYQNSTIQTSNDWQKRIAANLIDQDPDTIWQADRILWTKEKKADLVIDLKNTEEINRLVWINAFGDNTPTRYSISFSLDGTDWKEVKNISSLNRIDVKDPQTVEFESQKAHFVKMTFFESLNKDSPGISEVWAVPTRFVRLDINDVEKFLEAPFDYVPDLASFRETLQGVNFRGDIKIAWQNDKNNGWINQTNSKINVIYDGRERSYKLTIPAGGTKITKIKLFAIQIPGQVILKKAGIKYLTLEEIAK